jgi:integrase
MTLTSTSRATFADLIGVIKTAPIEERRRQDMASAVKTIARALGRPPAEIPLDLRALNSRLKLISPQAAGITTPRWHNVRSLFRAGLAIMGPVMKGRDCQPLSEGWARLYSQVSVRGDRIKLSRLLRWLSAQNIEPEAVAEEDLGRFHRCLTEEALLRDAEGTWAETALAWNRATKRVFGWSTVRIARQTRRMSYVLSWSAFPPSLKQDVDAWMLRLAGKDFAEDGPPRPLSPASLAGREYHLRAFASALVLRGRDPADLISLAACLTLDNFIEGMRFFFERFGNKPSPTTRNLGIMLKGVAKHWLKADEETLQRMREISRKLDYEYNGLTEKNRDRLRPFIDLDNCRRLLRLPLDLRQEVERGKFPPHRRRVLGQVAVAIELLLLTGLRAKNLARLELDRHLVPVGKKLMLVIPGTEVKNGVDLTFDLPVESVDLIRWYLKNIRKAEPGCMALFPNADGFPKDQDTLAIQINATVKRCLGFTVNPHLFRHIAAHMYLLRNPGGYEVMRRVLGHKRMETTSKFYAGLESLAAARHFDEEILKLRANAKGGKKR